jgi:hypothetical protein
MWNPHHAKSYEIINVFSQVQTIRINSNNLEETLLETYIVILFYRLFETLLIEFELIHC